MQSATNGLAFIHEGLEIRHRELKESESAYVDLIIIQCTYLPSRVEWARSCYLIHFPRWLVKVWRGRGRRCGCRYASHVGCSRTFLKCRPMCVSRMTISIFYVIVEDLNFTVSLSYISSNNIFTMRLKRKYEYSRTIGLLPYGPLLIE